MAVDSIYELSARSIEGETLSLAAFRGSVLLVVNTASRCGFTPQFRALEALYRRYRDEGLVILGFPCDQFAHQEPLNDGEIVSFCSLQYDVTFQMMAKVKVNGTDADPVFRFLRKRAGGWFGSVVKWNFTKFLVSRDGTTVRRFAPLVSPEHMEDAVRAALGTEAGAFG